MIVEGTLSKLLAPGIRKVFNTAYSEAPSVWESLFNSSPSNRAYEEDTSWAGFETFQQYDELENIDLRNIRPGFTTRYVHRKWGLGYQISREAVDDNLYGTPREFPAHLARAFRATKEIIAASIFNLGFSGGTTGGDGKTLFATDHPLYGAGGGTQANTFSTARALSHSSLKDAIIEMKRNKADDAIFSPVTPSILLVPDYLQFTAQEILNTTNMPYSADNTVNVLQSQNIQVVTWSYLTDANDWFLLAPKAQTHLNYFERWPLNQIMKDIDENQSMMHLAYARFAYGWSHFHGTWGVQGA